jgi:chromatin remodeling complex protein RSC6
MVQNANKGKKEKASKKEKVIVEKVAKEVEAVKAVAETVSDVVMDAPEDSSVSYTAEFEGLVQMADDFLKMAREFKSRVTKLEKTINREHKQLEKKAKGKRRRVANPDAPPSGFAKPGPVSDELRKFLNLGKEDLIARTEVTKAINAYCKEHKLQNEADKRKILPDTHLRKLLKMKKSDELTFFNLQTYLKVHFPNKEGVFPTA